MLEGLMSRLGLQKSNRASLGWRRAGIDAGRVRLAWPGGGAGRPASWRFRPGEVPIGDAQLSVAGTASGALFDSSLKRQPAASRVRPS